MVMTKNRAKAGTTEFLAIAQQLIPLDDPKAEGNWGLEGVDEESVSRRFKTKAAAVRWLRAQAKTLPHMQLGQIRQCDWVADDFEDDRYGLVLDAIEVEPRGWDYWVEPDKTLTENGGWANNG